MVRIKSEITEDFEKILSNAGMTKEAYPSIDAYKDDAEARVGSDNLTTIEALYGVKPEGQDYKHCIMEQAHPNSVIIAPSYDKTNGLVENNIERANIMHNIVLKHNEGNHYNPKYAKQELMMELVRIANEMDNKNKGDLFKLADSCLIDLSAFKRQPRVKQALAPFAVVGIAAGIATVLGAIWLATHADNPDHGPIANCDRALKALTNLKTNSWYESDVDTTVQTESDQLIGYITRLKSEINKFITVSDEIYKPRSLTELKELIKLKKTTLEHGDKIAAAVEEFKNFVVEIEPILIQSIENFTSTVYQKQHTKPSMLGEMTGWLGEALHGRWGLIANDFASAVSALNPLKTSIEDLAKRLSNFDQVVSKYEQDVKKAAAPFEESSHTSSNIDPTDKASTDEESFLQHLFK